MVQRYRLDVLKISALDWLLAETSLDILGCLNPKDVTSSVLLSVYIHAKKDSIVEILSKMDSVTVHDGDGAWRADAFWVGCDKADDELLEGRKCVTQQTFSDVTDFSLKMFKVVCLLSSEVSDTTAHRLLGLIWLIDWPKWANKWQIHEV